MAACGIEPSGRGRTVTDCRPSEPVETCTTSPVTRVTVSTSGAETGASLAAGRADAASVGAATTRPAVRARAPRYAVARATGGTDDDMQGSSRGDAQTGVVRRGAWAER